MRENAVHEIRAGQVQALLGDLGVREAEQLFGLIAELLLDAGCCRCAHGMLLYD